jgi:hypothetical protein
MRVYERFTEGFDTADLRAAKALLDTLQYAAIGWGQNAHHEAI